MEIYRGTFDPIVITTDGFFYIHYDKKNLFKTEYGETLTLRYIYDTRIMIDGFGIPYEVEYSIWYVNVTTSVEQRLWVMKNIFFSGNTRLNVISEARITSSGRMLTHGSAREDSYDIYTWHDTSYIYFNVTSGHAYSVKIFTFHEDTFEIIKALTEIGMANLGVFCVFTIALLGLMVVGGVILITISGTMKNVKGQMRGRRR